MSKKVRKLQTSPSDDELHGLRVEPYLKRSVRIDPLQLQDEFVRVPSDIAYWNELHARELRLYLEAKLARERILAELLIDPELGAGVERRLGKRPTVEQLKSAAMSDPTYLAARDEEIIHDVERQRLRGCVDALATKRDMLVSLGAHVRLELMADPAIRSKHAGSWREEDELEPDDTEDIEPEI